MRTNAKLFLDELFHDKLLKMKDVAIFATNSSSIPKSVLERMTTIGHFKAKQQSSPHLHQLHRRYRQIQLRCRNRQIRQQLSTAGIVKIVGSTGIVKLACTTGIDNNSSAPPESANPTPPPYYAILGSRGLERSRKLAG